MGSGDLASVATTKYAIRLQLACDFAAGNRRLLLRGGREITSDGGERWNARGSENRGGYYR